MGRSTSKGSRGSRGRAGFGRALKLLAFLPVATRIPTYARLVTALVLDDRVAGRPQGPPRGGRSGIWSSGAT